MSALHISLFGTVHVCHGDEMIEAKVTPACQALLGYLLLYRHRPHPREVLAAQFWGDLSQSRAHSCLNTTLWRLRRLLEPEGTERGTYLVATPTTVAFNATSDYWLDVATFEATYGRLNHNQGQTLQHDDTRALEAAIQLYRGDLLEGCYQDWALHERERLYSLYVSMLFRLMRHTRAAGAFDDAIEHAEAILRLDPLREEVQRELMDLYLQNGQRVLALRQFEVCRDVLKREMNIAPMDETMALYLRILATSREDGAAPVPVVPEPSLRQQLLLAIKALDQAREHLQRALGQSETYR